MFANSLQSYRQWPLKSKTLEFSQNGTKRESEWSLKHEMGLIYRSFLLPLLSSPWGPEVEYWFLTQEITGSHKAILFSILFLPVNSLNSVKTFRENSILFSFKIHNLISLTFRKSSKITWFCMWRLIYSVRSALSVYHLYLTPEITIEILPLT